MEKSREREFFLDPTSPRQRQYEALRAVFVDGMPQKDAADRFGYTYGAFRQLVRQFRGSLDGDAPPFSAAPGRAGRKAAGPRPRSRPAGRSTRR